MNVNVDSSKTVDYIFGTVLRCLHWAQFGSDFVLFFDHANLAAYVSVVHGDVGGFWAKQSNYCLRVTSCTSSCDVVNWNGVAP